MIHANTYEEILDDTIGELMSEKDIPYTAARMLALEEFNERSSKRRQARDEQERIIQEQLRIQKEKPMQRKLLELFDRIAGKVSAIVR